MDRGRLLILTDADVDGAAAEQIEHFLHVGISIVVGEEDFGFECLGGFGELLGCHGEGKVAGKEGYVDGAEGGHLGYGLGVAGYIDHKVVDGDDVSVASAFGMELGFGQRGVVGRNGEEAAVLEEREAIVVGEVVHGEGAEEAAAVGIGNDEGGGCEQLTECEGVEVVGMLMGDEYHVGFGHEGIVGGGRCSRGYRIHIDMAAGYLHTEGAVLYAMEAYGGLCRGGEMVVGGLSSERYGGQQDGEKKKDGVSFHDNNILRFYFILF